MMKIEVRYFSRGGNTKVLAEAIAKGAGVSAISVDEKGSSIIQKIDCLFIVKHCKIVLVMIKLY